MGALKFSALWLLFAATYIVFFIPVFLYFPEIWLHDLLTDHGQNFMDEGEWDTIFMSVVLLLALVINLVFIFFSFTIKKRLHKPVTNDFQQRVSVRMKGFKFSSLWLLFAATYCVFYILAYSFLPVERWLFYLLREDYQNLIVKGTWYVIFEFTAIGLALVINLVFIFLSLTIIQRLRNKENCTDERI